MDKKIAFLKKQNLYGYDLDFSELKNIFSNALRQSLNVENGPLRSYPCYTDGRFTPDFEKTALVVDAGGTHFRVAAGKFSKNGGFSLSQKETFPMPGTKGEISFEEFLQTLGKILVPRLAGAAGLGVCFSFDGQNDERMDLKVVSLSKGVLISGMEGKYIGASLRRALSLPKSVPVAVLNDAAASIAGGSVLSGEKIAASFVLGTGFNASYAEPVKNIKKPMRPYKKQTIVINTEAGNFPFEKRGAIERSVDECSENPGSHLLEKSVSGKYLGEIFARAIAEAGKEGLWENDLCGPFASRPPLSLSDMENFLDMGGLPGIFLSPGDKKTLCLFADAVLEKSARLAAAFLCAACERSMGEERRDEVSLLAEGSAYLKSRVLRGKIDGHLNAFAQKQGVCMKVLHFENVNLAGAAAAVL